ncbi:MAG: O-antigen ligase family protein [Terrimicrobiaceae bacterium]
MRVLVAVLLALAIVAAQFVYGGLMRTAFSLPCYALVAVAGILGAGAVFWKRAVPPRPEAVVATLVAGGFLLWRSLHTPARDLMLFYAFLVTACVAVYCLCACVMTSPTSRYTFVSLLLLAALGQVVVSAIQFSEPGYFWPLPWFSEQIRSWYCKPEAGVYSRGHGIFLNANHLAWFLNGMTFLALGMACLGRTKIWVKIVLAYVAAVCVTGTVLTLSRGGMIGLGAGLAVFLLLSLVALGIGARDRRLVILLVILATLAAGLGGGYYLFSQSATAQARMSKITEDSYRTSLWPAALRQAQIEPLVGTGAGTFTRLSRQLRDYSSDSDDTFAHNDWAQTMADFGFIGLVLVSGAFFLNWRAGFIGFLDALRQRMSMASRPQSNSAAFGIGALAALAAFAAHSFFDFNMQIPANALLASACAGILANSGVAPWDHTGKRRAARWLAGITACACGVYLAILLFRHGEAEWCWLRAENALIQKNFALAGEIASRGLDSAPQHPGLRRLLGEALLQEAPASKNPRENYVLSTYHLRRATEFDPGERWNHLMLAISLASLHKKQAAGAEHIEAIRLDPGNPAVHEYHALFLEGAGKTDEAIRAYEVSLAVPGTKFSAQRLQTLRKKAKSPPARR